MKRRILSIFMCLCMTLCLLPTAALADSITQYDIWVGGVRVTSKNASSVTGPGITGTVSYNVANNTLTLSGASITGAYMTDNFSAAIYAGTPLTIVLIGANTAVGPYAASGSSCGVYCCTSALTIEGNGSLNAVAGKAGFCSYGVDGEYGVSISGATVTATGGEASLISCGVWGCSADVGVSISGSAKVTATGGKADGNGSRSIGICGSSGGAAGVSVSGNAMVTATGGTASGSGSSSYGVDGFNYDEDEAVITVNRESGDGLLIAKSGSATTSNSTNAAPTCGDGSAALTGAAVDKFAVWGEKGAYYVFDSASSVTEGNLAGHTQIAEGSTAGLDLSTWPDSADSLNETAGGYKTETVDGVKTLTLKNIIINAPDAASGDAYGIKLPNADVNIVLDGANIVSAGDSGNGSSLGVYNGGGSIIVSSADGGSLYTLAGSSTEVSYGVGGVSGVTLSGTVIAIGGTASGASGGVYGSCVTVSGTVTAIGGMAAGNSGVSSGVYGGSVIVKADGTVTATGGTAANASYGVSVNSVTVEATGTLTATGGTAANDSYGVYGNDSVTLSGTVIATGGTVGGDSGFSYGVYGNDSVTLSGTVIATGGAASGSGSSSYGVYGHDSVTLLGTIVATGGSGNSSFGVYGYSGVILSGTVTATGSTASGSGSRSYGVYSGSGNITISGMATATGGTATGASYGMFSGSGTISVTSGTVGSSGSSQAMSPAPDYSAYTSASVIASANADGSSPVSYDKNHIADYKYLKIGTLYALTVNLNGGNGTTATNNHMAGEAVSINAGTKSGYTFSGWTVTGGGTFANSSSAATTYTMPAGAATITANWTANFSDGGTSTTTVPVSGSSGAVNLSASVSGSTATVSATDAQLQKITSGTETGTVKIDASGLKVDTVVVPSKLVTAANSASGSMGLEVALPTGTVTLDKAALAAVSGKGDIKLSVQTVDSSKLTKAQKSTLGNQASTALVVDVNVYVNGTKTSTFGDGKISVSVPYKPKSRENTGNITVWFIKDDGTIEPKNGVYNAATGCVEFTTEHLSQYLIVDFPFMDVAENAWYYGSVAYAYNNGLFAGTSDTAFSPGTAMTRQMIWMVLARMDGKTPADMDAARTWAMENGISDGSNPTSSITREQMATILYRYAQYKGCDTTQDGMAIREFTDYDSISEFALPALAWTVNAGLMQGSNNSLMPTGSATRAQVATILQRFCQNVAK